MNKQLLSVLVPMYNEAEVLPVFFPALIGVLEKLDIDYKIICVDDGSSDDTLQILREAAASNSNIQVLALSRNFGKEAAMTAALDHATGDAVLPIDADLQDPPELIGEMIAQWRAGYDVVYAKRVDRATDTFMVRSTANAFYRLFNKLSEIDIPENVGDFRLMDRRVVEAIKSLPEKVRFMKGLFCWPGFNHCYVEFSRPRRPLGKSKFNFWLLWNFALGGITSFSTLPIRFGVYLGLLVSTSAFFYGVFVISKTAVMGVEIPGYASLLVVILFLGGVQLFFLGLMGEYIGRIYMEVKNRPVYLVAEKLGLDNSES